jgi:hypothetical protein
MLYIPLGKEASNRILPQIDYYIMLQRWAQLASSVSEHLILSWHGIEGVTARLSSDVLLTSRLLMGGWL